MAVVVWLLALLLWFSSAPSLIESEADPGWTGASTPPAANQYAHPELLAEPAWLADRLDDPNVRVVALTPVEEFAKGHIPGAAQIDWPALEITDTSDPSIARWQGIVEAELSKLGLEPGQTIVVYDGGTLYAPRLWWILEQLGHDDNRVLNGGLAAWTGAGGAVETGSSWAGSSPSVPYRGTPDETVLATLDEVSVAYDDPGVVLVDARSAAEYAQGHVPGAVNAEFTRNADPGTKHWQPAGALRTFYAELGVTPDRRVIPYCTTGVRSAVTYFTLRLLGYEDIALFTGSWAEWSANPELSVATGDAP